MHHTDELSDILTAWGKHSQWPWKLHSSIFWSFFCRQKGKSFSSFRLYFTSSLNNRKKNITHRTGVALEQKTKQQQWRKERQQKPKVALVLSDRMHCRVGKNLLWLRQRWRWSTLKVYVHTVSTSIYIIVAIGTTCPQIFKAELWKCFVFFELMLVSCTVCKQSSKLPR